MLHEYMSATMILTVWTQCPVGGPALLVLQAIAEASNEQGNCYLSVGRIAAAARVSRSSALRALRALRDERWVVASRILGQGSTMVYQLNLPKLGRSRREGHDSAAMDRQRVRCTGSTEAGLLERVAPRKVRCQDDTSNSGDSSESRVESQIGEPNGQALAEARLQGAFGLPSTSADGGVRVEGGDHDEW